MDSGGEPLLPTADLLDVVFRNDGSAMDNSPSATPVRALEGTAMMTYYNDLYSRYAAHFNHTPGTSVNEGFYKAYYYLIVNKYYSVFFPVQHNYLLIHYLDYENFHPL